MRLKSWWLAKRDRCHLQYREGKQGFREGIDARIALMAGGYSQGPTASAAATTGVESRKDVCIGKEKTLEVIGRVQYAGVV
jgi:hypothetical protein